MGNASCNPPPGMADELFLVARNAGVLPDVTLDPTLASYLSLSSATTLNQQFAGIQGSLTAVQLSSFQRDLVTTFGPGSTIAFGGVGVVALALSLLFEALAIRAAGSTEALSADPIRRMFGADHSSDVGPIASEYLKLLPRAAGDRRRMELVTQRCEQELTRELQDHFDTMTMERRISSPGMKQWLNGAVLHLHMRVHLVRLGSANISSATALAASYRAVLLKLMDAYSAYLHRNVQVTPPDTSALGLLTVEPLRNTTHLVRHRPCESDAIAGTLTARILKQQDIQRSINYFLQTELQMDDLIRQQEPFTLQSKA